MPLKLNVGLSKKVGLPDYGSLGASCHLEVELDSSLLSTDLEKFQANVRRAYVACAQAGNDEVARHQAGDASAESAESHGASGDAPNGQRNGNGAKGHRASQK